MDGNSSLAVVVVAFGVGSAIWTFNQKFLSPNERFFRAMCDVLLVGTWLFGEITGSKLWFYACVVMFFIMVGNCIYDLGHRDVKRREFNDVVPISEVQIAMYFYRHGKLSISKEDRQRIKNFLGQVSARHVKQAQKFTDQYLRSYTEQDFARFHRNYSRPVYQDIIKDYWKTHKD